MWLIWSIEHSMWWMPGRRGYTPDRSKAGRYTFSEAKEIVDAANQYMEDGDYPNEAMVEDTET